MPPLPTPSTEQDVAPGSDAATAAAALPHAQPHQRLRWAMHGALLAVALLLLAAGLQAWQGEQRRASDAELINLAGAQRMLSQRVALLALQAPDDNGLALDTALARSQDDALRIEALLAPGGAALPDALANAVLHWQATRERLWYQAHILARQSADGATTRRAGAALRLRAEAERTLNAAQALVTEIQRHADTKSASASRGLLLAAGLSSGLLLLLAGAVVEPAARFVRRSHQRLAEQAAHLARLALVARHTHNLVVIADTRRRITWVNEAFTRITGYALAEAVGQKPADLLQTPAVDPATVLRMRSAMDQGLGVRVELLNRSKHGRDYWLDVDIQPLHDGAGRLTGFIAVQTDITAQVSIRQNLRALLDALPTGVVQQDASGRFVEANQAAAQMLGLTQDQLLGRSAVDNRWRTVRDDMSPYPGAQHPITRSARDGASVRSDSVGVLTPDGEQRWLLVNSEPLRDAAGAVAGAVACFIDVTEQRAQRTLLQLALQAAAIGTWQWRVDTDKRQWSAASCAMLGYSVDAFTPLLPHWRERIHPQDRPQMEAKLQAHLDNPATPYRCEMRVAHAQGHWVWVQAYGSVVERDVSNQALRMVGVHIDVSERKRHEQQLQTSAWTDTLTGLPNRARLLQRLGERIALQRSGAGGHFALLFLDFDRFKQVNDSLGHAAGDALLCQIAQRLRAALRQGEMVLGQPSLGPADGDANADGTDTLHRGDLAARYGGDEFVVLLGDLHDPADAATVAERLLQVLARPYDIGPQRVHSSASIGLVTSTQTQDDVDPAHADLAPTDVAQACLSTDDLAERLLRQADTAMYAAKQSGRGRWLQFEPRMQAQARSRADVEGELHNALERDELFVVYQPVLDLPAQGNQHGQHNPNNQHGCAGVEALVRWRHPAHGVMPPLQFVPAAEDAGLIGALGLFVLRSACHQFMRWRLDLGAQAPSVLAVNLSIAQLRDPGLVAQVQQVLADCAMPAAALQLEVTESLAAQDPVARSRLHGLKALGVKLALDDFGSGYSSLACLQQLPVDTVKIDRSFVVEAERSEYHRAVIEATVRVARTLRMATVAEGIETAEQASLISRLGCDRGQGFLYCRPLDADALTAWLVARPVQHSPHTPHTPQAAPLLALVARA